MNKDFVSGALSNIDEQFIIEARAEQVSPSRRLQKKHIISVLACACACAVTFCVCLPFILSPSSGSVLPPQIDTGTPPSDANPPVIGTKPPITDNNPSSGEMNHPYIEEGYISNGAGEPISPLMMAYKIDREFDENAEYLSVQLSFGAFMLENVADWGITKVVINVWNHESDEYPLKELTTEEFLDPKYDVKIKCTIEEDENGELTTTSETRIFQNEETFLFPNNICNKDKGVLTFSILAFDGDKYVSGSGIETYYVKRNGKINFITWREYRELEE